MIKLNKKIYYFLQIIIVIFGLNSCKSNLEEIKALGQEENIPDISITELETTYSTNAIISSKINAPLVNKYSKVTEPYFEFPKGVIILFYDKNKKEESSLKADYAIYFDRKMLGKAEKNVIITNNNGSTLKTEQLYLDDKNKKIYSEKPVTITDSTGSVIHGQGGFISNMSFTVYSFTDVTGIIMPMIETANEQK